MMLGRVDSKLEAFVPLTILRDGERMEVEFLIDTGFFGEMSLSASLAKQLGLDIRGGQRGMTADGRLTMFSLVDVTFVWEGESRTVSAQIMNEPMIGTMLLRGHELVIPFIADGQARITKL